MQQFTDKQAESGAPPAFTAGETAKPETVSKARDPVVIAKSFLQRREASVREEVASTIILSEGVRDLGDDQDQLHELFLELAKAKVLTVAEIAAKTKSESTLSKLRKIGEHQSVILHPKIVPLLQPGYSVLYELALLYEALEATDVQG